MKKILLVCAITGLFSADAFALDTFLSTDKGSETRTKLNNNFTALDTGKEPAVYVGPTAPADTTKSFLDTDEEPGVIIRKKYVTGTGWVREGSYGVQYLADCSAIPAGMCVDSTRKLWYHNGTEVVEVGTGSGSIPTASAETLGVIKVGSRLTITDGVLSADIQTTDISGKENSLGNPSVNGYVLSSTTGGTRSWIEMTGGGTGIAHATSDGNYYASKDGGWASLSGVFAAPLGSDDNYVTDAEKIKLSYTLDTDLSSVSASDDSLPSAKATKAALDAKANSTGISFVAAALSDLKYDPDTGTADDEYNLITNTGSVGDANAATVIPTLERSGALFAAIGHNHSGVYEPADATIIKSAAIDTQGEVETIWSVNLTNTIASGTASMGTSAIADGACASAVTVSASGVATTDIINMGFNGTPVGVTGYDPTGTPLNIIAYPTANNVNFLVCNSTGSSVTPGSLTINWRVDR